MSIPGVVSSVSSENLPNEPQLGQVQLALEKHIVDVKSSLEAHHAKVLACLEHYLKKHDHLNEIFGHAPRAASVTSHESIQSANRAEETLDYLLGPEEYFLQVVPGNKDRSTTSTQSSTKVGEQEHTSHARLNGLPSQHILKDAPSVPVPTTETLEEEAVESTSSSTSVASTPVEVGKQVSGRRRESAVSKFTLNKVFHTPSTGESNGDNPFTKASTGMLDSHTMATGAKRSKSRPQSVLSISHILAGRFKIFLKPKKKNCCWRLMKDPRYSWYICFLVLIDAIVIVWESEVASTRVFANPSSTFSGIEDSVPLSILSNIICLAFIIDLAIRLYARRLHYFLKSGWHSFNALCVISLLLECIVRHAWFGERSYTTVRVVVQQASVFRMLRLLQIVNQMKVIQTSPLCRELRLIVDSILSTFSFAIASSLIVLFFCIFFACFITEGFLSGCLQDDGLMHDCTSLRYHFGTMGRSTLSLYKAMAGGEDWGMLYEHLDPIGGAYKVAFLCFQAGTLLVVLNVFNAVLVECAIKKSKQDEDQQLAQENDEFITAMGKFFRAMDSDNNGIVSLEEFKSRFRDEKTIQYFNRWGITVSRVGHFLDLLDNDHSGDLTEEEFTLGCMRLRGMARSLDLADMHADIKFLIKAEFNFIRKFTKDTGLAFESMMQGLKRIYEEWESRNPPLKSPTPPEPLE